MIHPEHVIMLSKDLREPSWLLEKRIQGFNSISRALPADSPTERHYTNVDLNEFTPDGEARANDSKSADDIHNALKYDEKLIRKYLYSLAKPDEGGLGSLNAAIWQQGYFIHVPKGEKREVTLNFGNVPSRALIVADEGSSLAIKEESNETVANQVIEIVLEKDSKVTYYALQGAGKAFTIRSALLKKNSNLKWVACFLNSKLNVSRVESTIDGEGACAENYTAFVAAKGQHHDISANSFHLAKGGKSIILNRGALGSGSAAVFRGAISIGESARQTNACLRTDALLLGKDANASSIPSLDIRTNDVQAKHSATVGQMDEEMLFYLTSRGLPRKAAERLILEGFFSEITDKISEDAFKERAVCLMEGGLEE
jgi:Fe-S cluster assembly protein SufD